MNSQDLENYESDLELQLFREYRDVVSLFTYVVETERRFYLTNSVKMEVRNEQGRVYFELDASPIKDQYTLRYTWHDPDSVTWTLVDGKMLKAMDGAYELEERSVGGTEVTYRLAVDIAIPMIGMLRRKAEKEFYDPARIRAQLEDVDRRRAEGSLSEEEAAAWEDELVQRLLTSQTRPTEREA